MSVIPTTVPPDHSENNICNPPAMQCSRNQSTLKCRPNINVPGGCPKQPYLNCTDGGSLASIKTKYESEKYVFETSPSWAQTRPCNGNVQKPYTNVPKICAIDIKQSTSRSGDLKNCYGNDEKRTCQSGKDKVYGSMVRPYICKEEATKKSGIVRSGGGGSSGGFDKPIASSMQSSDSRYSNGKSKNRDEIRKKNAEMLKASKKKSVNMKEGDKNEIQASDAEMLTSRRKRSDGTSVEIDQNEIQASDAEMLTARRKKADGTSDGIDDDGNEDDLIKMSDAEMTQSRMKDGGSEGLDIHIVIEENDASQEDFELDEDGNIIEKSAEMTKAANVPEERDTKKPQQKAGFGGSRDDSRYLGGSGSSMVRTMSSVQREFCNRIKGLSCFNPNATCREISYLWCANQPGPECFTQTKNCEYEPFSHNSRPQSMYYGMGRFHHNGHRSVSASHCRMPKR